MASDSTGWPLLEERAPLARVKRRSRGRRASRPAWLLAVLGFVCGGLVSAAVFTIGWRHQAQRNTAAETALARATAHEHALSASLAAARRAEARDRRAMAEAKASAAQLARAAAAVAAQAAVAKRAADPFSTAADSISSSAARLGSELKTLTTYLTQTPPGQLDPGYVASQAAYLSRQIEALQSHGANLGNAATGFDAAIRKLTRLASTLPRG